MTSIPLRPWTSSPGWCPPRVHEHLPEERPGDFPHGSPEEHSKSSASRWQQGTHYLQDYGPKLCTHSSRPQRCQPPPPQAEPLPLWVPGLDRQVLALLGSILILERERQRSCSKLPLPRAPDMPPGLSKERLWHQPPCPGYSRPEQLMPVTPETWCWLRSRVPI